MALRNVLIQGESTLNKTCRPVTEFNSRLHQLLDDMAETLMEHEGIGLAAPQVGILRRVILVLESNVESPEDEYIIELINPEIIEVSGSQREPEGCLSVPGEYGVVQRPMNVKVRAQDRYGEWFEVEGTGLTARCFCHEVDHLNGILFTSLCERLLTEEDVLNGEYE